MHQYEGMQHLLSSPLHTGVDLLDQATFQELNTLLAQGGVDQSFHRLDQGEGAGGGQE